MKRLVLRALLIVGAGCVQGEVSGVGGGSGGGTGGGTGTAGGGGGVAATSALLTWDPPTKNADDAGTPLTDLAGYKVKRGTVSGTYTAAAPIDVGNVLTYTVSSLPAGTHYFVVTAYDTSGNESVASNEGSKTIP